jgi:hypothetical protein
MSDRDLIEAFKLIRGCFAGMLFVIALSGFFSDAEPLKIIAVAVVGVLVKP